MKRLFSIASLAAILAGCTSVHTGVDGDDSVRWWKPGTTTLKDMVSVWGNPDTYRANECVWHEAKTIGGKFKASYMMVGLTVSNRETTTREYRCRFDDNGVLESIDFTEAVPGGPKWSPIPFTH